MKRYLRSGEAKLLDRRLEMHALHRDGHEFPIEMTISAVEDEGSTSFYSFLHDISERKQDERYRAAQLAVGGTIARAPSLEEAMPTAIAAIGEGYDFEAGAFWAVDEDGQLRCKTFWSADPSAEPLELASRNLELLPGQDLPGVAVADKTATWVRKVSYDPDFSRAPQAEEAGLHSALAAPLVREDRVFGVIELFTSAQQPPKPEALDALAVISSQLAEFAARTLAERDAERVKDEFFALVSHELRTPLTSIIGYTDMLVKTESEQLSAKGRQMLEVVRRNAQREMRLVGDLLMLVRIEAGSFELEPGIVDLNSIVRDRYRGGAPARREVRADAHPRRPGRARLLGRRRAGRAGHRQPSYERDQVHRGRRCGGPGIRHRRVRRHRGRGYGAGHPRRGHGPAVRPPLQGGERHRGTHPRDGPRPHHRQGHRRGPRGQRRRDERGRPGHHLPHRAAAERRPGPAARGGRTVRFRKPAQNPLVLVADDDEDLLELASMQLEQAGYRVAKASDGTEALRVAREELPDACVFDVVMPGLRGHEVLQAMREGKKTKKIPVVLITATLEYRSLWRLGPTPDDCMRKQSIGELEDRVGALLAARA